MVMATTVHEGALTSDTVLDDCSKLGREQFPLDDTASTVSPTSRAGSLSIADFSSLSCYSPSNADTSASIVPSKKTVTFLRNVLLHGPHPDPRMGDLIDQARELAASTFEYDVLGDITKKSHRKLTLLASEDLSTLCGFLVVRNSAGAISVADLAVPVQLRGLGFGKLIMEDLIRSAKKQGDIYDVCLSSLSTAVTFYQRLGFKAYKGVKVKTDFEAIEGQVYMEKHIRPRPRRK
jgi:ribosomal protein S18 acetylase RimI-like enzyme